MNPVLGSVFWLLVTLGVLVTFHEFGHYWVARRCGVKVLRFSVGFGKAIWKHVGRDGCEYQVAAIPLGGYVKMLDAREGEVPPELRAQEFTAQSVWKRIAIVIAGPGFNLIFTIAAFWLMFVLGRTDYAPIVTATPHSIAAEAGIRPGDRLLQVGNTTVTTWSGSLDALGYALLGREPLPVTVRDPDGTQRVVVLQLEKLPAGKDVGHYLLQLGIKLAPPPAIAANVEAGQPAAAAGIQGGDRLVSVNGQPVANFEDLGKLIAKAAAQSPRLVIGAERHGKPMQFQLTARKESIDGQPARWIIGVGSPALKTAIQHYGPVGALRASLSETWGHTRDVFDMIREMLSGRASTSNLSGVIGIAQVANASASQGLSSFLQFLALVSLSLGILNLLPIPILDGGHLLYYLIELVKGSPLSERAMIAGQYVGLLLLFTLMGLAFYNDIHRIILPT
ncbi:RIP metalloprotease RseP [Dyella sp. A6]|uniref:RIP metalloprotease RseP n=1 Tax=Dyella aluminiiresistens TaxID=3069105 RepID=UPI002E75F305|nr:RIP metalloprotease RseP [Dyella sp. A6]